jgi:hypothetical protein
MQSHKLPPLLQQVLSKLDVAYGDPGRVVDLGDIAALMEAIGFTIDPREHPGWVTVMNKIMEALGKQAIGKVIIPPRPGVEAVFMDLASRAFTATRDDQTGRRRLEAALRRAGIKMEALADYRNNLQRPVGPVQAEKGAIRRQAADPFPSGVTTADQQREWLLGTLENLAVTPATR